MDKDIIRKFGTQGRKFSLSAFQSRLTFPFVSRTAYFPDFRNHLPLDHIEPDYCSNIVITDISAPPSFEQVSQTSKFQRVEKC